MVVTTITCVYSNQSTFSSIEMEKISSTIGNNLNNTNSALSDAGGDKLVQAQENYLCENATKITVLGQKTSVSAQANEKYRLRLVKTIRVKLAE